MSASSDADVGHIYGLHGREFRCWLSLGQGTCIGKHEFLSQEHPTGLTCVICARREPDFDSVVQHFLPAHGGLAEYNVGHENSDLPPCPSIQTRWISSLALFGRSCITLNSERSSSSAIVGYRSQASSTLACTG
jgi:hypothetical protein